MNSPNKKTSFINQNSSFSSDISDKSNEGITMRRLNVQESFSITIDNHPVMINNNIKLSTISNQPTKANHLRTISTEKFSSQRSYNESEKIS